jgi:hypothetical protein
MGSGRANKHIVAFPWVHWTATAKIAGLTARAYARHHKQYLNNRITGCKNAIPCVGALVANSSVHVFP